MKCARRECSEEPVFRVVDLAVEFYGDDVGGKDSYVRDGQGVVVCHHHVAEYAAVANDSGDNPMLLIEALDYGKTHLIAEGVPMDSYRPS